MSVISKIAPSADLVSGMMSRLGKAPTAPREVATRAHAARLRMMVLQCTSCPDQESCAALQAMTLHCDAPPNYCPNAAVFDTLPRIERA